MQKEVFLLIKIKHNLFLFSVDPYLHIMKCHLLSFFSKKTQVDLNLVKNFKILISEKNLELNKQRQKPNSTVDMSLLASQALLHKKFTSLGAFIKTVKTE